MTAHQKKIKENKNILKYIISVVIIIAFIAGAAKLYALTFTDNYVSPITTANIVYAQTECRLIINKNPGGYSMMIPTKYSNEWTAGGANSFINNPPTGVTVLPCTNVAYAWGQNLDGQIGNATTTSAEAIPLLSFATNEWKQLVVGNKETCGINLSNNLYCWGNNWSGKLGIGSSVSQNEPTLVSGGYIWKNIGEITSNHVCAITTTNQAYCWGRNANGATITGRLGTGNTGTIQEVIPALVAGGQSWKQISAGANHSCGVTIAGQGYCWGGNDFGEIGDNTTIVRHVPTLVSGGYTWKQISAGAYSSCGITTSNQAYCWGLRSDARIGDGILDGPNQKVPSLVSGGYSWKEIAVGTRYSCGIINDNRGLCWGSAVYGKMGNGVSTGVYATPQSILGLHSWKKISPGLKRTCGLTTNDKIYCWGDAVDGGLGNGVTSGIYPSPILIKGEYSWKDISTSQLNTAGIQKNHRTDRTGDVGVIVTASSSSVAHPISGIIDDYDTKGWASGAPVPQTVQVDFGSTSSNVITQYTLYRSLYLDDGLSTDAFGNGYSPKSWKFQASNNATTWIDLDIQSGQVILDDASPLSYSFTNTTAYRYYRLYITASNVSSGWVSLSEIEMSESDL